MRTATCISFASMMMAILTWIATSVKAQEFEPDTYTVALYHFDEGMGTALVDASGRGHNGTIEGATWDNGGKYGRALRFDGSNDYVIIPSPDQLGITNGYTIEAWVKPSAYGLDPGAGNAAYVISGPDFESYEFHIGKIESREHTRFLPKPGLFQWLDGEAVSLNQWNSIAIQVDQSGEAALFVNGEFQISQNIGSIPGGSGNMNIGRRAGGPSWPVYWNGLIDEKRISNAARYPFGLPNNPPVAKAGEDQNDVVCTSCCATEVTLDGTSSSDPDGDPLTYTWRENGEIICEPTEDPTCKVTLACGSHTIELTVDDSKGGTDTDEVIVEVVDTTPPTLSLTLSPDMLWPPNHKMVDIQATVTVADICDAAPSVVLASITSDEPDNGLGDGDKPNDIQGAEFGTADVGFRLRAERSGNGDGRAYAVTYTATDASSNSVSVSASVTVPHDLGKPIASQEGLRVPQDYVLLQNYPNPFNPETEISYQLPEANHVVLRIYNATGQEIRSLVNEEQQVGFFTARWDGRDNAGEQVSSGLYFYTLRARKFTETKKALFMR